MLSKILSAAANAVKAVGLVPAPRMFGVPVPNNGEFGATAPEFCQGKAIHVQETRYGSGRWTVDVFKKTDSGDTFDGNLDGFTRPQTTAQVIAGLDRIFEGSGMPRTYIHDYRVGLRQSLTDLIPQVGVHENHNPIVF